MKTIARFLFAVLLIFFLTGNAYAATKYAITGGGNWSGATWATASNQAVSDTTKPVAGDAAILDQYSGSVTIDETSACASIDCTGYTGTLTQSANMTTTGNITFVSGMGFATSGTPTWNIGGSCNFDAGGKSLYNFNITYGVVTLTTSDMTITNNLTLGNSSDTRIIGTRTLTLTGGTWSSGGGSVAVNLNLNGNIIISGQVEYERYNITGGHTLTYQSGVITTTGSTLQIQRSCTLNTNGMSWNDVKSNPGSGGDETITLNSALDIDGDFTVNIFSTKTLTIATSDITVGGDLIMTSGAVAGRTITLNGTGNWTAAASHAIVKSNLTFNTAGTITISGNVYYNTGTLTYSSGTITTTGSTLNIKNANTNLTTNGMTWNNISCTEMNAKTLTLGSALQVGGNLNLTGTTTHTILACGANNVTVGGNFTNPKGTTGYTANAGQTFTIGTDGNTSVIDGATNWKNFTITPGATVTLDDGDDFAVAGTFTAIGTAGDIITFSSDNPGTQVDFDPTTVGSEGKVYYVHATDINGTGATEVIDYGDWDPTSYNCTNWTYEAVTPDAKVVIKGNALYKGTVLVK